MWIWNRHTNDLDDWCPHSGTEITDDFDDDAACPARCADSYPVED